MGSTWVLAGLLVLITWPRVELTPMEGLDPSWMAGLYMAAHGGLAHGQDIVYTFGPLGFLRFPVLYYPKLTALALAYTALTQYACCVAFLYAARRTFTLPVALLIAFIGASVVGVDRVVALAFVVGMLALDPAASPLLRRVLPLGGGVLAAVEFYGKLSIGVIVFALLAVAVLTLEGSRRRNLAVFASSMVLSLLVLWLLAGQSLAAWPDFVVNAGLVVAGYSAAMEGEDATLVWEYWAAAALAGLLATVAWRVGSEWGARRRWGVLLLTGLMVLGMFKAAFVRHDAAHTEIFFGTLVASWVAFRWRPEGRAVAVTGFLVLFVAYLGSLEPKPGEVIDPAGRVEALKETVTTMASREQRLETEGAGRARITAAYGVDPELLDLLGDDGVHISPWETAVAWGQFLDWRPLPVFQEYSAYMPHLDEINAERLASDEEAPGSILRQLPPISLDSRYQPFDSPKATLEMLCRYRVVRQSGNWEVLERSTDRCGEPSDLGTVEAGWGDQVSVPNAGTNEAVLVRIGGAGVGGLERLRSLLYKPVRRAIELDGAGYRLITAVAGQGLLLHVPRALDHPGAFALAPNAETVAVVKGSQRDGGNLRYRFFSVPLAPPAA